MFDWKYAADQGKCEEKWPYDEEMVAEVKEVYDSVVNGLDAVSYTHLDVYKRQDHFTVWKCGYAVRAAHTSAERNGISGCLRRGVRMRIYSSGGDVTDRRNHSGSSE